MIAVTFEVWPREGKRDEYLALAAEPRDEPIKGEGLISIERFESLHEEGKLPSLQFRRDEACVGAWRERLEHRRHRRRRLPAQ